jgi:hypothetical protein
MELELFLKTPWLVSSGIDDVLRLQQAESMEDLALLSVADIQDLLPGKPVLQKKLWNELRRAGATPFGSNASVKSEPASNAAFSAASTASYDTFQEDPEAAEPAQSSKGGGRTVDPAHKLPQGAQCKLRVQPNRSYRKGGAVHNGGLLFPTLYVMFEQHDGTGGIGDDTKDVMLMWLTEWIGADASMDTDHMPFQLAANEFQFYLNVKGGMGDADLQRKGWNILNSLKGCAAKIRNGRSGARGWCPDLTDADKAKDCFINFAAGVERSRKNTKDGYRRQTEAICRHYGIKVHNPHANVAAAIAALTEASEDTKALVSLSDSPTKSNKTQVPATAATNRKRSRKVQKQEEEEEEEEAEEEEEEEEAEKFIDADDDDDDGVQQAKREEEEECQKEEAGDSHPEPPPPDVEQEEEPPPQEQQLQQPDIVEWSKRRAAKIEEMMEKQRENPRCWRSRENLVETDLQQPPSHPAARSGPTPASQDVQPLPKVGPASCAF